MVLVPTALGFAGCDPGGKDSGDRDTVADDDIDDDDVDVDVDVDDDDDDDDDEPQEPEPEPKPEPDPKPEPRPDSTELCDPEAWEGEACTTDRGQMGTTFCVLVDGEEVNTPCSAVEPECSPGEDWDMGCIGEICYWDGTAFRRYSWEEPDCDTPLVVDFGDAPIEFMPAVAASFDLSSDGTCVSTDWPTAPFLALDRDRDGVIRSGTELFGSATAMASGATAAHGFAALAELDSDRDGKITAADARFDELVLWSDVDDDRMGTSAELRPLFETTLVSIDLSFARKRQCDDRGNCGYERAPFAYRTSAGGLAAGEVVDVHLACR